MTDFAGAGPFGPLGRPKDMKERLEENTSERTRLRTAVEYNGERKRSQLRILTELICLFAHTKFLLNQDFILSTQAPHVHKTSAYAIIYLFLNEFQHLFILIPLHCFIITILVIPLSNCNYFRFYCFNIPRIAIRQGCTYFHQAF